MPNEFVKVVNVLLPVGVGVAVAATVAVGTAVGVTAGLVVSIVVRICVICVIAGLTPLSGKAKSGVFYY